MAFSIGDKVRGRSSGGHIVREGNREVKEEEHFFEGVVVDIESEEDSDVGEEMIQVKYTKKSIEQDTFKDLSDWHYASELKKLS